MFEMFIKTYWGVELLCGLLVIAHHFRCRGGSRASWSENRNKFDPKDSMSKYLKLIDTV